MQARKHLFPRHEIKHREEDRTTEKVRALFLCKFHEIGDASCKDFLSVASLKET
jgi:hypothetical protein